MKPLQRVIARCAVLGTLLWLTACASEDFLKVESVRSPLMEDFESYASINSFTDDGIISDKGVLLDVQLTKERLKLTKDIPLSQLVDWSVVREVK